ncbi:hypothetical protein ES703_100195 [subsurface metagenome]
MPANAFDVAVLQLFGVSGNQIIECAGDHHEIGVQLTLYVREYLCLEHYILASIHPKSSVRDKVQERALD